MARALLDLRIHMHITGSGQQQDRKCIKGRKQSSRLQLPSSTLLRCKRVRGFMTACLELGSAALLGSLCPVRGASAVSQTGHQASAGRSPGHLQNRASSQRRPQPGPPAKQGIKPAQAAARATSKTGQHAGAGHHAHSAGHNRASSQGRSHHTGGPPAKQGITLVLTTTPPMACSVPNRVSRWCSPQHLPWPALSQDPRGTSPLPARANPGSQLLHGTHTYHASHMAAGPHGQHSRAVHGGRPLGNGSLAREKQPAPHWPRHRVVVLSARRTHRNRRVGAE